MIGHAPVRFLRKYIASGLILLTAAFIVSCEGESRPFEEAVEVQSLGLTRLQITKPFVEQTDNFIINNGQTLQLGLSGTSDVQSNFSVDTRDRQWSTSDSSVVSVTDDGIITGGEDGEATISLNLGGIEAVALPVEVANRSLEAVAALQAVAESDLERCIPGEYFAIGRFADQTQRPLYDAIYTVDNSSGAILQATGRSTVLVNASSLDAVGLTAATDEVAGTTRQITVLDTLTGIQMTPSPAAVDVEKSLQLRATGTYTTSADPRTQDITENVQWSVITGDSFGRINNATGNKGILTGVAAGAVSVQASCGSDIAVEQSIVINAVDETESTILTFENASLEIELFERVQLEVSRGSEFDDNDTVTDEVFYSIENIGSTATPISVSTTGLVTGLVAGGVARITATFIDEDDVTDQAEGSILIRVSDS